MNAGAGAAAIALAARAKRLREEEEEEDLHASYGPGWEFKILRSTTGRFRRPDFMARVLDEESKAGWRLVEKFDNYRLRLARPVSRRGSGAAGVDPYRTVVGISEAWLGFIVAVAVILVLALTFGVLFLLVG